MRIFSLVFTASVLCLLPSIGHAQSTQTSSSALWVSARDIKIDDQVLLKTGVEKSLGLKLIRPAELEQTVRLLAQKVPIIDNKKFKEQLWQARRAFVNLNLKRANNAYTNALKEVFNHPLSIPDAKLLARVYFEKSQISKAKRNMKQAHRELRLAMTLSPKFRPDPDRFGPPAIRSAQAVKRSLQKDKKYRIQVNRAPFDAQVYLNGKVIDGKSVQILQGTGPHLLTAERVGYQAYIRLIDLKDEQDQELSLVMKEAIGPVLAQQVLGQWLPAGAAARPSQADLDHSLALQLAKISGMGFVIEAASSSDAHVELKLSRTQTAEIERSVRGRRMDWEPWPYAVVSEALAGRTVERPDLNALMLALSGPSRVNANDDIELIVQIRDSASQLRGLKAQCGEHSRQQKIAGIKEGALSLSLKAPDHRTDVFCQVFGMDDTDQEIVMAPPKDTPLKVIVDDPINKPWYGRWYVWTAVVTAVAAGGAGAAYLGTREGPPEEHRLVFEIQ
jgi:hypothetical protein